MDWQKLDLVVEGGFAGLKRGASIEPHADALDAHEAAHLGSLVSAICALPAAAPKQHPDSESVAIDVHTDGDTVCRRFDSADLPHPAAELLKWISPRLKPLPRG